MAYLTVGDYLKDARTLLQDRVQPYRYSTGSLVHGLNLSLLEVRRMRPDLLVGYLDTVPQYDWSTAADDQPNTDMDDDDNPTWSEIVPMEQSFRKALVYGISGFAFERDQEDIQTEYATAHVMTFENMLTEVKSTKGMQPPKG